MSDIQSLPQFHEEIADLFTPGRLAALTGAGLDFLEARGEGACTYDQDGRRYIDCTTSAGTFNLGRRHPELIAELKRAMHETDQGNFPMISREKALLAKALADFAPGNLECCIFSVMRGEAMDAACKIARGFTGRSELITVDGGWYGQTGFALTLSQREDKELYGPLIPDVRFIPFGDADAARRAIGPRTAAIILEPIQAENHCQAADADYLRVLARLCRDNGSVLVLDETQTGFGRTGRKFACEESGVVPDILIVGEALGAGVFPIAATVLTQRVNAFLNAHPLIHLSTFGGSDVGCRVATKAIEIYEREKPWENAARRGEQLLRAMQALTREPGSPIRAVAGKGLLLSLDLGTCDAARDFCRNAARHGLLVAPGQVARHTVLLRPSLLITEEESNEIVAVFQSAARRA